MLAAGLSVPFAAGTFLPVTGAQAQVWAPPPPPRAGCDYYCRRREAMERWRREELKRKEGGEKPDRPGQKRK